MARTHTIQIRVDNETLDELDALVEARQLKDREDGRRSTRSDVVRALIHQTYIAGKSTGQLA